MRATTGVAYVQGRLPFHRLVHSTEYSGNRIGSADGAHLRFPSPARAGDGAQRHLLPLPDLGRRYLAILGYGRHRRKLPGDSADPEIFQEPAPRRNGQRADAGRVEPGS